MVDEHYAQICCTNLYQRSLGRNLEFNLEVYGGEFARDLPRYVENVSDRSSPLGLHGLVNRSFPIRLIDATARLL